jgi:hypothetical protein
VLETLSVALVGLAVGTTSAALVAKARRERSGLARAGSAAMEIDALFSPGRCQQLEQQRVVELVRDEEAQGGPSLLDVNRAMIRLRGDRHGG